jgi:hypothetical protein
MYEGSYPTAYDAEPRRLPHEFNSVATADTALTIADTYYDAATLGTLPPGLYLVSASVYVLNGGIAASFFNTKILVGAVAYAPTETSIIISGSQQIQSAAFPIEITAAAGAVVKVQAAAHTTGAVVKFTTANGGALTSPTWIVATRIR